MRTAPRAPARPAPRSAGGSVSFTGGAEIHPGSRVEITAHRRNRVRAVVAVAERRLLVEEIVDARVHVHTLTDVVGGVDLVIPFLLHAEIARVTVVGVARQHLA